MGRCGTVLEASARLALTTLGPFLVVLAWGHATVWAASTGEPSLSPREMIDKARLADLDGRNEDRDYWARQALQEQSADPAAHWLAGEVQIDGRWTTIAEAPSVMAGDDDYRNYLRIRSRYPDTVRDQSHLADWCVARGLTDQARAHYSRVIDLDPDNATARRRLGFTRFGGQWRTREELTQTRDRRKQLRGDLTYWRPKVQKLQRALSAADLDQYESARAQLREIDDPAAVPALETVLGSAGEKLTIAAVDTIGSIRGQEASLALARLAAFSRWKDARQRATTELKSRPLVEFVPAMLGAMIAPIEYRDEVYSGNGLPTKAAKSIQTVPSNATAQRLLHRQVFSRETQTGRTERAFDTKMAFVGTPAMRPMLAEMAVRSNGLKPWEQAQIETENLRAMAFNRPIAAVLCAVTGENLGPSAESWWNWWDQYNEIDPGVKPTRRIFEPKYQPTLLISTSEYLPGSRPRGRTGGECFAAGTTVWTIDGPKPIERISVGDLVLSQNAETGELAFKPVLRAAVRQPVKLVTLTAGKDVIRCTGGHPFWIPRQGWVHARRIDPSAYLHALTGATRAAVDPGPTEKTYNLEVADFHSYFVGSGKYFVHDVTPITPTTTDIPGLKSP